MALTWRWCALLLLAAAAAAQHSQPTSRPKNRLAGEKSPYLRQHVENPVDWQPWSDAAFAEAKRRDAPVLVSVGYSACHWCHVMERESFMDDALAEWLNVRFVSIKVDREEMPDLDALCQRYVGIFSRESGGWPTTVLLTPDRTPIWAGTYYPPVDRGGRISFRGLLENVDTAWRERRDELMKGGAAVHDQLREASRQPVAETLPAAGAPRAAAHALLLREDRDHGGFGAAPKFPQTSAHDLLFAVGKGDPEDDGVRAALRGLDAILNGGIHDHVGGGFHRYSTDARWLVPHFEKMLYDQALIGLTLIEAYRIGGAPRYAAAVEDTVACLLREFRATSGGFISAHDADSEGAEGAFFVWRMADVKALLTPPEWRVVEARFALSETGNWHEFPGVNVLAVRADWATVAATCEMTLEQAEQRWQTARGKLAARRAQRPAPARDIKIVAETNGYAITFLARAGAVFRRPEWVAAAEGAAAFVLASMRRADGSLFRRHCDGEAAHVGVLADHAAMARGLLELFEATGDVARLDESLALTLIGLERFEAATGGFFDSPASGATAAVRLKDPYDGATPAAQSTMIDVLQRLGEWLDRADLRAAAHRALRSLTGELGNERLLVAHTAALRSVMVEHEGLATVIVVGDPGLAATRAMWSAAVGAPVPSLRLAVDARRAAALAERLPILEGKSDRDGKPQVFVCRGGVCKAPLDDAGAVRPAAMK